MPVRSPSGSSRCTSRTARPSRSLGFSGHTKSEDIKDAYKRLVKIHHPDANGGDKSSEDRLRTIIAAYSHLKKAGFVGK